mgnify:CR=1 FL=1|jgi:hypothetical protein
MLKYTLSLILLALLTNIAFAGTGYQVTSQDGDETVTYRVNFGGARRFEQHTAYDPASEKFVYLKWDRGSDAPEPVCSIWNHETGKTIKLYQFPGVENPLPIIPSINAMKVCPKTGDENFKHRAMLAYD